MSRSLELIEIAHGLLRVLPDCGLWGVDDGALVLGEDATQFVFCWHGALTVRQSGAWPHVLTAGMWASVPGKCEIQKRLGMEREEVTRLVNRAGMPAQAGGGSFNKAWIPGKD